MEDDFFTEEKDKWYKTMYNRCKRVILSFFSFIKDNYELVIFLLLIIFWIVVYYKYDFNKRINADYEISINQRAKEETSIDSILNQQHLIKKQLIEVNEDISDVNTKKTDSLLEQINFKINHLGSNPNPHK